MSQPVSLLPSGPYEQANELEIMARLLPFADARVLELGCGKAWMTRRMAEAFPVQTIVAMEVDRIQHEQNLALEPLPRIEFRYGGMEAIDLADASVDIAIMLKSLHHVPSHLMNRGLAELHRVVRPGGLVYISEPVFAGAFNEIMQIFHDEEQVRQQAFAAVCQAVEQGLFQHQGQHFFESPGHFENWQAFEQRMLNVTHTEHRIDDTLYEQIRSAFMAHMTADGAHFMKPSRVDLLLRP
jgi:ubiquinone/menaquinone biosynthesis C-methylase UbiE